MSDPETEQFVDPDPIVIVSTLVSVAALILQFVSVRNELRNRATQSTPNASIDTQQLDGLENAVDDLRNRLKALERTIERASPDIDAELYNAKFRISESRLNIDTIQHQAFNSNLTYLLNNVGQISSWVNTIISLNARLAVRIGDKLSGPLVNTAQRINAAITKGDSNRTIITEAKQAIETLADVLHDEMKRKGN